MTTTATPQITGVDFVCVPTRDHDRAAEFYSETLGLERVKQWGNMPATEFKGRQPHARRHGPERLRPA